MQAGTLKGNCTLVYNHLAGMMELIKKDYTKLMDQDPELYKQFILHKRAVVDLVGVILGQLAGKHIEVIKSAQLFVNVAHNLHQYIVQLVIQRNVPTRQELEEMVTSMPSFPTVLFVNSNQLTLF